MPNFEIHYKHETHGSDKLGCDYKTLESAIKELLAIQSDPEQVGWSGWLKDASLWVTDENGNIFYS